MIAFQIGLALALLVTGQVDLQLDPESVALKRAAADRLDDAKLDRYGALLREMQKVQPKLEAMPEGPERDQAEQKAMMAAANKVGFPPGELAGFGMLVSEWLMATGPTGGPKEAAARKAGFTERYGKKATAFLERNDARLKKIMSDAMQGALDAERGKPR